MQNGKFSTVNTSEYHRTGNAVLLSDILEVEVPQKYFLSKEQTERIIFADSSDTEKATTETLKCSIGGGRNGDSQYMHGRWQRTSHY